MATKDEPLPETMISPETGETLARGVRPFTVAYKGESVVVDLPGYYPTGDGKGVHIGRDKAIVDQALRGLKEKADNGPASAHQASAVLAGGGRSFQGRGKCLRQI
jgi:HTH-type transcriptional regulator/antitoxin MqsA